MLKRSALAPVLLLAAAFAATARADTPPPADTTTTAVATIADGVTLGGVAVGGMTVDLATQAVQARFARPVLLRFKATTVTVTPDLLGVSVPFDTAVAKALTVAPNTTLGLHGSVDAELVSSFVERLAHRFDRKPIASMLSLRGNRPVVSPEVVGRQLRKGLTAAALSEELLYGTRATIALRMKFLRPAATTQTFDSVIVIRRASNLLTLYSAGRYVRQFRVATGQAIYPTPLGRFHIVVMWKNPWWYPPADPWARGEKPTPPGPGNPLGTRWMGLSAPGVGIHGTPVPGSIGYSLSHGCIRMLIPSAEWLFDHVRVGTTVYIVAS
jgi:lipoprotein-anchoring transpeptidase ErfK/SrfK